MGDSATAMRDPAFYRWHAYINYMFEQYKHRLPPYTVQQVNYKNIWYTYEYFIFNPLHFCLKYRGMSYNLSIFKNAYYKLSLYFIH